MLLWWGRGSSFRGLRLREWWGVVLLTEALTLGRLCQDWAPREGPAVASCPGAGALSASWSPRNPRWSEALDVRLGLECQQQAQGSSTSEGPLGACGDPGGAQDLRGPARGLQRCILEKK